MEKPIKPVMWTDEEVASRFKNWLYARTDEWQTEDGFIYYHKTNDFRDFQIQNNKYCNNHDLRFSLNLPSKLLHVTIDSLLHEINVICPIGRLEYESKWIDKILSGQKTMSIRKTQYMCGYYELWDTDQKEVKGIVEVTDIAVMVMQNVIDNCNNVINTDENPSCLVLSCLDLAEKCGFGSYDSIGFGGIKLLADYHRTNFQSIKYAITYQVVDMKGDAE